jgi:pimeloyl-ACP methyl ester carboxylesterase
MAVFSLVHGGQHGAWCFERLIPELEVRGHRAIAVDLPIEDADAGARAYAGVVVTSLAEVDEPVVVVGHSMGGLVIPLIAELRPVRQLVFLCAAVPEPGRSHVDVKLTEDGESVAGGTLSIWAQPGDRHRFSRELARELFYHDCAPGLQEWALDRLRLQSRRPLREVSPLATWPGVPVSVMTAGEDRCIPPASIRATARRLFHQEPIELPGGHLAVLSHPAEVAEALTDLVDPVETAARVGIPMGG